MGYKINQALTTATKFLNNLIIKYKRQKMKEGQKMKQSAVNIYQDNFENYVMEGNPLTKTLNIYHLIIAPTYQCNLRCKHCYLSDFSQRILPKDILFDLIDQWNDIVIEEKGKYGGIFHLKGGEPFLIPYLDEVLTKLKEVGNLRLMITTNGTIFKESIFREIAECKKALNGHVLLIVSLDGATKKTHSILRGEGNFEKTLKFLEKLNEYEIDFQLNCVLHDQNIHEIKDYLQLAKNYGAKQVNFLYFIPRGNGTNFASHQISHFEHFFTLKEVYDKGSEKERTLLTGSLPNLLCNNCKFSNECTAGYRGLLYILPNGDVYPCPNTVWLEFKIGNIFKEDLKIILSKSSQIYKKLRYFSGYGICEGEKILYSTGNKNNAFLEQFSEYLKENFVGKSIISYCYNRNW